MNRNSAQKEKSTYFRGCWGEKKTIICMSSVGKELQKSIQIWLINSGYISFI